MDLSRIGLSVSRETLQKLEAYRVLLQKWNQKINLVAKSTLEQATTRHFLDSFQLLPLIPDEAENSLDLGSGGGFPGLVCAIVAAELYPKLHFTLVESDQRKCAFLRTVVRETNCDVTILNCRIEELEPMQADVVTARALSTLSELLSHSHPHLSPAGKCLFLKGKNHISEVDAARKTWHFDLTAHLSITNCEAAILELKGLSRV